MTATHPLREAMQDLVRTHADVHLLGEAMDLSPVTAGLRSVRPAQVHMLPASDASLVGTAVGMAIAGAHPVVELAGGASVWGALQQLAQEAAGLSTGEFRIGVTVRIPLAPEEELPLDLLASVPGLVVAAPSSADEAAEMLRAAVRHAGPVVLLEGHNAMARRTDIIRAGLGGAAVLQEGDDVTIVALGDGVAAATDAAAQLAHRGIRAELVDLRIAAPLDVATLSASVHKTGRLVTVGAPIAVHVQALRSTFLRLESPPFVAAVDAASIVEAAVASVQF